MLPCYICEYLESVTTLPNQPRPQVRNCPNGTVTRQTKVHSD